VINLDSLGSDEECMTPATPFSQPAGDVYLHTVNHPNDLLPAPRHSHQDRVSSSPHAFHKSLR
jgi:hypothetical protein